MSYNLFWKGPNVKIKYEHTLFFNDLYKSNNLIYGDPRFDQMQFQIKDFSSIVKIECSIEELKIIAALEKSSTVWNSFLVVVFVTSNKQLIKQLDIYLDTFKNSSWKFMFFDNVNIAENCTLDYLKSIK